MLIGEFLELSLEDRQILLKTLVHDLIFDGPMPAKALADDIGKSYRRFCRLAEEESFTHNLRLDQLPVLTHRQQNFLILDFFEHLFGRTAFAVPKPSENHTDINRATTKALKSFSGYMEEVSDLVDRLDDGENMFDRDWDRELKEIELTCRDAQGKLEALLHTVRLARGVVKIVKLGTALDGFQVARGR